MVPGRPADRYRLRLSERPRLSGFRPESPYPDGVSLKALRFTSCVVMHQCPNLPAPRATAARGQVAHADDTDYMAADFFETAALLITFICLGRFLEAAAKGKTSKVRNSLSSKP